LTLFLVTRIFFFKSTIIEQAASYLIYPALKFSHTVTKPIKKLFKKRRSYNDLLNYCNFLKNQNEKLLTENIKLKSLNRYAHKSKELREFADRYKLDNAIPAKILMKNLSPTEHSFIVNRGSRNGVEKNMVALYKFQLLGRVTEVFPTYSKITLISDRQSKVSAYTNSSNANGIVTGTNKINRIDLRHISHLKRVNNGDFVLSNGQGLIFPEGFCLGKIINITTDDICHHVEVEPLIDFNTIEMCHLTNQSKMNLF
jgi:rod shape-determining protein MreC